MKRIVFLLLLCFLIFHSVKSQITLNIVVKNLENNKGSILVDFRDGKDQKLKDYTEKIVDKKCSVTVRSLSPGKYSFKYFHDENNNKELDKYWIGAPSEGYGFSNNAKGTFGPPDFKETIFEIKKDTTIFCTPYYFNF